MEDTRREREEGGGKKSKYDNKVKVVPGQVE